jgi:hypothetical protein
MVYRRNRTAPVKHKVPSVRDQMAQKELFVVLQGDQFETLPVRHDDRTTPRLAAGDSKAMQVEQR